MLASVRPLENLKNLFLVIFYLQPIVFKYDTFYISRLIMNSLSTGHVIYNIQKYCYRGSGGGLRSQVIRLDGFGLPFADVTPNTCLPTVRAFYSQYSTQLRQFSLSTPLRRSRC